MHQKMSLLFWHVMTGLNKTENGQTWTEIYPQTLKRIASSFIECSLKNECVVLNYKDLLACIEIYQKVRAQKRYNNMYRQWDALICSILRIYKSIHLYWSGPRLQIVGKSLNIKITQQKTERMTCGMNMASTCSSFDMSWNEPTLDLFDVTWIWLSMNAVQGTICRIQKPKHWNTHHINTIKKMNIHTYEGIYIYIRAYITNNFVWLCTCKTTPA